MLSWTEENQDYLRDFSFVREIGDHGLCGIQRMCFTTALWVGIEPIFCEGRYCYKTWDEAREALEKWDGVGDPSGNWIKAKFAGKRDRHGTGSDVPMEFRNE